MASDSDRVFLERAVAWGFLRPENLAEILTECGEAERALARPVPVSDLCQQHRWLAADQILALWAELGKRPALCPFCYARINVHGYAPGRTLGCAHCKARLSVPLDPVAAFLEPETACPAATPAVAAPTPDAATPAAPAGVPDTALTFAPPAGAADPGSTVDDLGGALPLPEFSVPLRAQGFEVLETVGRGSFGVVFKARQASLGRTVAIKVLLQQRAGDPAQVRRFFREARAIGAIEHPNVVRIYHSASSNGCFYLVLQWIQGRSLLDLLNEQGALMPDRALGLLADVAKGLAAAHAHAIVHRDVKPSNILVTADGTACVTDFGLARFELPGEERLTRTGQTLGTPLYMSPEQCRDPRHAGPSSDIYSLGATLFHLVAGLPPFAGKTAEGVLRCLSANRIPRLDDVPIRLPSPVVDLVHRLMDADPGKRPANMQEVQVAIHDAFLGVLGRPGAEAPRPSDTTFPEALD